MPDKFFVDSEAFRIDLEDSQWVEIKSEMSIGDWEIYEAGLLQIEAEATVASNRAERRARGRQVTAAPSFKLRAGYLALLEINILRWSFPQEPTKEQISRLREPVASRILATIDERNPSNPLGRASATT